MNMRVVIDCDDIATGLKKILIDHLKSKDIEVTYLDYSGKNPGAFYPEIGYNLALKIKSKEFDRGILICGTGLGMAIIAMVS